MLQNSVYFFVFTIIFLIFAKNKKKMKHRKIDKTKFSEEARRKDEIASYGKMVSLRCSCVHKSKKDYNRQEHKKKTSQMMRDFCED